MSDDSNTEKIRIKCDSCGARIRVNRKLAGQQVKCPKCHAGLIVTDIQEYEIETVFVPNSASVSDGNGKYCHHCGKSIARMAEICPKCGVRQFGIPFIRQNDVGSDRVVAGLLALFFGTIGTHWFYLGNIRKGVIYLLCTVPGIILILPTLIVAVFSIVDGIKMLSMTDTAFAETYTGDNQRKTFL